MIGDITKFNVAKTVFVAQIECRGTGVRIYPRADSLLKFYSHKALANTRMDRCYSKPDQQRGRQRVGKAGPTVVSL